MKKLALLLLLLASCETKINVYGADPKKIRVEIDTNEMSYDSRISITQVDQKEVWIPVFVPMPVPYAVRPQLAEKP